MAKCNYSFYQQKADWWKEAIKEKAACLADVQDVKELTDEQKKAVRYIYQIFLNDYIIELEEDELKQRNDLVPEFWQMLKAL